MKRGFGTIKRTGLHREGDNPTSVMSSVPGNRLLQNPIAGMLLVVGIGLLSYSNTFHVPFVFDDEPSIVDNHLIKDLGNFFEGSSGYAYNPRRFIAYLSFAVNHHFGGLQVRGYHLFNICVHLINALLVFALVRLSFRTPLLKKSGLSSSSVALAFFAGLLFAVHPVQTQAVTYIVQRMTSLATLFSLASLCLYVCWRLDLETGNRLWSRSFPLYVSSLLSLVLAMRTKEIAFTIPVLIVLYDRFFFETVKIRFFVPFLLTLLIIPAGLLHVGKPVAEVLSDLNSATRVKSELSRELYLMTQVTVVATYLRLLFLPVNQNLDYDYPIAQSLLSGPVLFSALILLAVLSLGAILFFRSRPDRESSVPEARLVSFGIAWFFITLLVESSAIPIADVIFEHRIYLPSAGFFIALSVGLIAWGTRLEQKIKGIGKAFVVVMLLSTAFLAVATFLRNQTWENEIRLWTDVVGKSPRKGRPYYNLGLAYDRNGNQPEAMRNYITSISLYPYNGKAHDNLGTIFSKQGRFPEAIREFQTALELNPGDAAARNNIGNVFAKLGRPEDALREYQSALVSNPDYAEAYFNAGIVYGRMGDLDRAAQAYSEALKLDPDHGAAYNNLGLLLARQGRLDHASSQFRAAIAINPSDAEAWNNLGNVYAHQGKYEEAIRHFREALRWSQKNAEVHNNLGMVYLRLGRISEAIGEFQSALQSDPGHAGARKNLSEVENRGSKNP